MLYDVRLRLDYDYEQQVAGGRHLIRVVPSTIPGIQRVVAAHLSIDPHPVERQDERDFFGNAVVEIGFRQPHDRLELMMSARVAVERAPRVGDPSPPLDRLAGELDAVWSVAPTSPHHFLAPSPRVPPSETIAEDAAPVLNGAGSTMAAVTALGRHIASSFTYDVEATEVDTAPEESFRLKAGVCQDFAHVMIAGLRAAGIPAGYVSGFIRTIPPAGKPQLEGADAMHAWVRAWCGREVGWYEYDPTNSIPAGSDHIVIGYGRDYADVTPIIGVLRTYGGQKTTQAVDVIPVG